MPPSRKSNSSRKGLGGRFTVTGPFEEEQSVPNVGAGLSLAQNLATKHRNDAATLTYYVRAFDGTMLAKIEKTEAGEILTYAHSAFSEYTA